MKALHNAIAAVSGDLRNTKRGTSALPTSNAPENVVLLESESPHGWKFVAVCYQRKGENKYEATAVKGSIDIKFPPALTKDIFLKLCLSYLRHDA